MMTQELFDRLRQIETISDVNKLLDEIGEQVDEYDNPEAFLSFMFAQLMFLEMINNVARYCAASGEDPDKVLKKYLQEALDDMEIDEETGKVSLN